MTFTPTQARDVATEAFTFGFPLLLMASTMRRATAAAAPPGKKVAPNCFAHLHRVPDPDFRAIIGANTDTLYSLAWLDLVDEPVLLELPDVGERSYLMLFLDAWSNVFASLGPRTVGAGNGAYAVAGPGWAGVLPEDVRRIDAPTNQVWAICHLHVGGRDDLDAGRAIQQGLTLTPLSAHNAADPPPSSGPAELELEPKPSPHQRLMEMQAEEFFQELAAEMGLNPPQNGDGPMLARLAVIGLTPGRPFAWASLSDEVREALEAGIADGKTAVDTPPPVRLENGWQSFQEGFGDLGSNYLHRAQIANLALGIAHPEDAIFPLTATDGDGDRLNGAHRYTLRFEPQGLPPVDALWSLALYDMDQLFVHNPLDRYALGNRDELELGRDGSLEIAIQHERPDGSDANWLPAPEGDFNLMLHMYWPSQSALDGRWTIPPVQRID